MTELFQTFDDQGKPLGLVERPVVHRTGLWHKSSHVFLFSADGRLWVQERAAEKDLYAGLLDYSVGEHLLPGESHEAGALRGLREELGVTGVALEPIGDPFREGYEDAVRGIEDFEIQQAFQGVYDGPMTIDTTEVKAVHLYTLAALEDILQSDPGRLTPWFASALAKRVQTR